jgi:act minimal PKS acyl carrier protein
MQTQAVTADELRDVLQQAAGDPDLGELAGDWMDSSFTDLGYDSVALLETLSRIERRLGVRLGDTIVADANTPQAFLDLVNTQLPGSNVA